ncbi:TetR/AcrR family transcriptional regulator [Pseudochrobactrum sp. B5]|uniref:TetR/AcrR family transcriptional regulator n=1 Tax=Pseudochrobactrum sp. B5 TaxID=1289478 RepID=UPI00095199A6|nr:TetR/AcrR family transcriptional regulator [Pseudochrobactrum sp. B5]
MSVAHRRKKQPQIVRSQLLQSAADIAVGQGVQAVTMDSVAQHAGVSKGALQYHFPSKQKLLDALFDEVSAATSEALAATIADDPDEHGREARTYLTVTTREASESGYQNTWRVLLAAMMAEPKIREPWSRRLRQMNRPDPLPEERAARLMICRLAADGIWINELLGSIEMSPTLKAEVIRQLERMTVEQD